MVIPVNRLSGQIIIQHITLQTEALGINRHVCSVGGIVGISQPCVTVNTVEPLRVFRSIIISGLCHEISVTVLCLVCTIRAVVAHAVS